ncbi:hypothetical protein [Chitinophaga rhizophila]|uniref:Uncharacterized protein n=1 Tax=Chitinophaga rhizophila TaxID=2866212 RepID=A0ABS7GHI6_9BACT|nr:hypothetical protein [Chitinophaga rhizophila]MBW8687161.1 hypothetical protein [Chitinophaga rhizophila]
MFNTLANLIGLRIDDERIKDFIDTNGFKYPKKPNISNRSSDLSYWVENKKLGFNLLFRIDTYLTGYPPIPGDKKGIFVPVLAEVRWHNNKSKTVFPQGIDFNHDFDTLVSKLGAPGLKSSDISPTWLNDDGSESFYRWKIMLDEARSIAWRIEYGDDQSVNDISLSLSFDMPLFHMYYEHLYGTFDTFLKTHNHYKTEELMFLHWAIDNDLVKANETTAQVLRDIKAGTQPITEWIRALGRGYINKGDFAAEYPFVHAYINNLSSFDVIYARDFAFTMLTDQQDKDRYFSQEVTDKLNQIEYTTDNYEKIKAMLDRRRAEYREHKFSKSIKAL